jgi:hypothetical protein
MNLVAATMKEHPFKDFQTVKEFVISCDPILGRISGGRTDDRTTLQAKPG